MCERECPQKRYLFKGRPELTAADVATARAAVDPATGAPVVLVRLDQAGRGRFLELTRRVARRGRACRCPQHVAVLVKRRIESLPYIDFEVYPDGVPAENGVQINLPSLREARELARDLNAP